ncbi:MAG: SH3 domain-containing protein [Anaerolineales bacterium]|nr:SH3 domain-containing protein [Anaerolineales bacterium]
MKQFLKRRSVIFIILLLLISTQGCMSTGLNVPPSLPTAQDIEELPTEEQIEVTATSTIKVEKSPSPTATEIIPTATSLPAVTISAVKGNIYIRRGPGLAYNPIGVLYKGASTQVIARDVLSRWVQVIIPDSEITGWVSIQTEYSQLNGEFDDLPDFTFTDWPVPAYLENCTAHDMYVMPGEIVISSYFSAPKNEAWLNPGTYTVYDLAVPGEPEVLQVDIREGEQASINKNGLGEKHKCP